MDFQYQSSTEYEVREGIIDLYLNVKIRSSDEVSFCADDKSADLDCKLFRRANGGRERTIVQGWFNWGSGVHQAVSWDTHEYEGWRVRLVHQKQRIPRKAERKRRQKEGSYIRPAFRETWQEPIYPLLFHALRFIYGPVGNQWKSKKGSPWIWKADPKAWSRRAHPHSRWTVAQTPHWGHAATIWRYACQKCHWFGAGWEAHPRVGRESQREGCRLQEGRGWSEISKADSWGLGQGPVVEAWQRTGKAKSRACTIAITEQEYLPIWAGESTNTFGTAEEPRSTITRTGVNQRENQATKAWNAK